jgi:hypothetical protein
VYAHRIAPGAQQRAVGTPLVVIVDERHPNQNFATFYRALSQVVRAACRLWAPAASVTVRRSPIGPAEQTIGIALPGNGRIRRGGAARHTDRCQNAGGQGNYGFDAATNTYVDLVEAGIIDPTNVVRVALENAVSVAGVLLLTEATMTELPERKKDSTPQPEMAM